MDNDGGIVSAGALVWDLMDGGKHECASNGEEKMGRVKKKEAICSFPSRLQCS